MLSNKKLPLALSLFLFIFGALLLGVVFLTYPKNNVSPIPHPTTAPTTLEGKFLPIVTHNLQNQTEVLEYHLITSDFKDYVLIFATSPKIKPDAQVKVQGTLDPQIKRPTIHVQSIAPLSGPTSWRDLIQSAKAQVPHAIGTKRALVLVVNNIATTTEVQNAVFNDADSVRAYFQEVSYGKMDLAGTVVAINLSGLDCTNGPFAWLPQAEQSAQAQGYDLTTYDFVPAIFPQLNCPPGLPPGATPLGKESQYIESSFSAVSIKIAMPHELLHNLGENHSNLLVCANGTSPVAIAPSTQCSSQEYGDSDSVLGSGLNAEIPGALRSELGWFAPGNVQLITTSGTYTVQPIEPISSQAQLLRIPIPTMPLPGLETRAGYYEIEKRTPYGFDTAINKITPETYDDVLIHLFPANTQAAGYDLLADWPNYHTNLINNNPGAPGVPPPYGLRVGNTFYDPYRDVTIKLLSTTTNGAATVQVTLGNSRPSASPSVQPSPLPTPIPTPSPTPLPSPSATPISAATMAITKSVTPASAQMGDIVTFTLVYTNTGNVTATNVQIVDTLDAHFGYQSDQSPIHPSYNAATRTLTWSIGTVAAGASGTLTFQAQII